MATCPNCGTAMLTEQPHRHEAEPITEAGRRLLNFVTALIHPTDPPKPSVVIAICAIENEAIRTALAEINASEAMWHRRAMLAETTLNTLAKKVNELIGEPVYAHNENDYMCPNCLTPWKCNGPHEPEYGMPVDYTISRKDVLAAIGVVPHG